MSASTPTFLVTGASSGFGRSITLNALARGYNVVATSRSLTRLQPLKDAGAAILALDVTAGDETLFTVAAEAAKIYGCITHVVCCAGYVLEGSWEEASGQELAAQYATNVLGTLNTVRAFIPYLRQAASFFRTLPSPADPALHPSIATFGSLASWISAPGISFYCSTKWAVSGVTEGLRDELAPFGINVTVVEPGYFRTSFLNMPSTSNSGSGEEASHRIRTSKQLDEYSGPGGSIYATKQQLEQANNQQLGDVDVGAKVIVDVLTGTGVARGKEVPVRLPLGSDTLAVIRGKFESTMKLLQEWEEVAKSTDRKEGE